MVGLFTMTTMVRLYMMGLHMVGLKMSRRYMVGLFTMATMVRLYMVGLYMVAAMVGLYANYQQEQQNFKSAVQKHEWVCTW